MKQLRTSELIDSLSSDVRTILLQAEKLQRYGADDLLKQPAPGRWSVAQVIEHLNFYSRFYLNAIDKKLREAATPPVAAYKPGWFGEYFTNMMKPKDGNTVSNKMKALKNATPAPAIDVEEALREFINDQHRLLELLHRCRSADLGRIRVPTSITKFITLKLGDTLRFFIAHEQRHFVQIRNTLREVAPTYPISAI